MKETFRGCLRNLEGQTKKLLLRQSVERTREQQDEEHNVLKSDSDLSQKKASHPTPPQKGKKRRIPFVAYTFVVIFATLCVFSLVGPSTLISAAWASVSASTLHKNTSLSLASSPMSVSSCIQTNCYGQGPTGTGFTGPILPNTCTDQFQNASSVITTTTCADPQDFFWGNLDITCVKNDNLDTQLTNFNNDTGYTSQGHGFGPWWVNPNNSPNQNQTPVAQATHTPPSASFYNQNTCVSGHQCRSNNASGLDSYNPSSNNTSLDADDYADKTGGDGIVCKNDSCANIQTTDDTGASQGNVCGSGIGYDKLACYWINGNWSYNPTAYNPDGALEQGISGGNINVLIPDSDLPAKYRNDDATAQNYGIQLGTNQGDDDSLKTSGSDPYCNTPPAGGGVGHWTCDSGTRIVLIMTQGWNNYSPTNVFQGSPMTIAPTTSNGVNNNSWTYPPTWEVMCVGAGNNGGEFPCSDISGVPNISVIKTDWLSGDPGIASSAGDTPGHLALTYNNDTVGSGNVQKIFGITLGIGYLLIAPTLILIGYQMLWASWTFGRANAMEAFGRMILSIVAVGISFTLSQMLIGLANLVSTGLVAWHQELGYPQAIIAGKYYQYTLAGDTEPGSFRGVVVPVSRWGCIANDFAGLLLNKFFSDTLANIPFFGGFVKLGLGIADAIEFARRIGEFGMLLFSINLFAQVLMRLILLNYYILTGPIAFACWGLPSGVGQKVVSQWFKGFVSLLSVQFLQVFVLTTLPFVIPALPALPTDSTFGLLQTLLGQLPPLLVLMGAVKVPKLLGTGAGKAIAQAGTMTAGAVAAAGSAAYSVV